MRRDFCGEAFDDLDAGGFKGADFFWIVGDEADGRDAHHLQHFGGQAEVAVVGAVAQLEVGLDGVETLVLQFVGAEFAMRPMPRPSCSS